MKKISVNQLEGKNFNPFIYHLVSGQSKESFILHKKYLKSLILQEKYLQK